MAQLGAAAAAACPARARQSSSAEHVESGSQTGGVAPSLVAEREKKLDEVCERLQELEKQACCCRPDSILALAPVMWL